MKNDASQIIDGVLEEVRSVFRYLPDDFQEKACIGSVVGYLTELSSAVRRPGQETTIDFCKALAIEACRGILQGADQLLRARRYDDARVFAEAVNKVLAAVFDKPAGDS